MTVTAPHQTVTACISFERRLRQTFPRQLQISG
jgi:hypothetical protein